AARPASARGHSNHTARARFIDEPPSGHGANVKLWTRRGESTRPFRAGSVSDRRNEERRTNNGEPRMRARPHCSFFIVRSPFFIALCLRPLAPPARTPVRAGGRPYTPYSPDRGTTQREVRHENAWVASGHRPRRLRRGGRRRRLAAVARAAAQRRLEGN